MKPSDNAVKLSYEMRRVLKMIARAPATPKKCRCDIRTFIALAERKLIYVATYCGCWGLATKAIRIGMMILGAAFLNRG